MLLSTTLWKSKSFMRAAALRIGLVQNRFDRAGHYVGHAFEGAALCT